LKRQAGQPLEAQRIAWTAQHRLNLKYNRITARGKAGKFAVVKMSGYLFIHLYDKFKIRIFKNIKMEVTVVWILYVLFIPLLQMTN
jgi:hypothetical protein